MKLEVTTREHNSAITITAESEFEKRMLALASMFKSHELNFHIEDFGYYGSGPKDASVTIAFYEQEQKQ